MRSTHRSGRPAPNTPSTSSAPLGRWQGGGLGPPAEAIARDDIEHEGRDEDMEADAANDTRGGDRGHGNLGERATGTGVVSTLLHAAVDTGGTKLEARSPKLQRTARWSGRTSARVSGVCIRSRSTPWCRSRSPGGAWAVEARNSTESGGGQRGQDGVMPMSLTMLGEKSYPGQLLDQFFLG